MKNFDTKRFGHVLKLDFAEGLKPMLWGSLAMLLLYLFFFWFAHNVAFCGGWWTSHPEKMVERVCDSVGGSSFVAMLFFFLIAVSILYRGEQKKQHRIAWLMLPATNLEKFLSRWIYMLAFSIVGGMVSFFVADIIHMAYLVMIGYPVMDCTTYFFRMLPRTNEYSSLSLLATVGTYGMMITIHSFFLLGSVLFKKYHFIVTAALMVLFFAVVSSLYNALGLFQQHNDNIEIGRMTPVISMIVFETGVIGLFTWLAYRLFCRWQVVTRKFVNL